MINRGLAHLDSVRRNPQGPAHACPRGDRTIGSLLPSCGRLDPDRAFSVPHTAEFARQAQGSHDPARKNGNTLSQEVSLVLSPLPSEGNRRQQLTNIRRR
jgi:hypothetical protein